MFYIFIVAGLTLGFILFLSKSKSVYNDRLNMVEFNNIVKTVSLNWGSLENLSRKDFQYDYLVVDHTGGSSLYKSKTDLPDTLHDALQLSFVAMDVPDSSTNKSIGKVLVDVRLQQQMNMVVSRSNKFVILSFIIIMVLLAISFVYLFLAILHPFKRLEVFAKNIAAGHLDASLPMDRFNIFGAFTESFDVMRLSLLKSRKIEQLANESKKELIASLSHDIKTPTTSIRLIAELLQAQITDPVQSQKLKTIETKADQIDRLMNNMLHNTLEELGQLRVSLEDENSQILFSMFNNIHTTAGISVHKIPPCLINIDQIRLQQVFDNIISNSEKYAKTSIDIYSSLADSFLELSIKDYGAGVGDDELSLLFNKFYRSPFAIEAKKQGEGLGLYIAKDLMNRMNGDIEAINLKDGFVIKLYIPLSH